MLAKTLTALDIPFELTAPKLDEFKRMLVYKMFALYMKTRAGNEKL